MRSREASSRMLSGAGPLSARAFAAQVGRRRRSLNVESNFALGLGRGFDFVSWLRGAHVRGGRRDELVSRSVGSLDRGGELVGVRADMPGHGGKERKNSAVWSSSGWS